MHITINSDFNWFCSCTNSCCPTWFINGNASNFL
jgi:hypothetical protein